MYDSEGALVKALEEKFPGENVSKRFPSVPHGFVTRGNIKEHAAASGAEVAKAVEECVTEINAFFAKRGLLHQQNEVDEAEGKELASPKIQGAELKVPTTCCWPLQLTPRIWGAARPPVSSGLAPPRATRPSP